MEIKTSSKFVAELIGTFGLVLFGCGAAAIAGANTTAGLSGLGLLGIAVAFGLSVVVFAYAIGRISGCQILPLRLVYYWRVKCLLRMQLCISLLNLLAHFWSICSSTDFEWTAGRLYCR